MTRYLSVCVSLVEYVNFEFVWWRVRENAFPFLLLLTHQPLFIFVWTIIGKMYMIKACHFADLLYFGRKASYPYILKYITSFFSGFCSGCVFCMTKYERGQDVIIIITHGGKNTFVHMYSSYQSCMFIYSPQHVFCHLACILSVSIYTHE